MWEPAEFARHWQAEFPGEPAPRMQLGSVRDMELELERCRGNLRLLQQALAEEKFKVIYLEAALAREPPAPSPEGAGRGARPPPGHAPWQEGRSGARGAQLGRSHPAPAAAAQGSPAGPEAGQAAAPRA
nr:breakpoint cluster region protein-like [Caretta caretta]